MSKRELFRKMRKCAKFSLKALGVELLIHDEHDERTDLPEELVEFLKNRYGLIVQTTEGTILVSRKKLRPSQLSTVSDASYVIEAGLDDFNETELWETAARMGAISVKKFRAWEAEKFWAQMRRRVSE